MYIVTCFLFSVIGRDANTLEFLKKNYRPDWTYADFAKDFKAEFYDPVYWASLFKDAGAK